MMTGGEDDQGMPPLGVSQKAWTSGERIAAWIIVATILITLVSFIVIVWAIVT